MRTLVTFAIAILATVPAWADGGSHAGNGGDVIYCEKPGAPPTARMLDLFDAKIFENRDPVVLSSSSQTDPYRKLDYIIQQMSFVSPLRAERYRDALDHFAGRIEWVSHDLEDIPDSQHTVLPAGCSIRQIAIQDRTGPVPKYIIDSRLWSMLDAVNQSILILHEITYGEALAEGAINSIGTRKVVGFLFSEIISRAHPFPFFERLVKGELTRKLDFIFDDGSLVLLHPSQIYYFDGNDYYYGVNRILSTCGFAFKDGTLIDSCTSAKPYAWDFAVEAQGLRGIRGFEFQTSKHAELDGARFGLPVPVHALRFGSEFKSSQPFRLQNGFSDVRCLPEVPVRLESGTVDQEKFDLSTAKLLGCSLDPSFKNQIYFLDKWRAMSAVTLQIAVPESHERFLTGNNQVEFKNPETLEVYGQSLEAKSISSKVDSRSSTAEVTETIQLSGVSTWNFLSYSCRVQDAVKVMLVRGDVRSLELRFAEPCRIKNPGGGDFTASRAVVDERGHPIGDAELTKPATLKVSTFNLEVAVGKASFLSTGEVKSGRLAVATPLTVYDTILGQSHRLTKGRMVPAGAEFYWSEDGFSASSHMSTTEPMEVLLISWGVKDGRYVLGDDNDPVKVVGDFELSSAALLYEGTLAEPATLLTVVGDQDHRKRKKRRLRTGTKIKFSVWDGAYFVTEPKEN